MGKQKPAEPGLGRAELTRAYRHLARWAATVQRLEAQRRAAQTKLVRDAGARAAAARSKKGAADE